MKTDVKIKLLRKGASIPEYATPGSAAADLRACIEEPVSIAPGQIASLPTGIAVSAGRNDIAALIYGRSGLAAKHGITLANSVGVVDSDYRGEICVALINRGSEPYTVNPGDRIAQLMFAPVYTAVFNLADKLDETERAEGGFGSTGV
jgi:dUTP pyrophosphatase